MKFLPSVSKIPQIDNNVYLVLVGGVEGDLNHFGISVSHLTNPPRTQLDAFQQGWLWRIPRCVPLGEHTQDHISAVTHIRILKNGSRFVFMESGAGKLLIVSYLMVWTRHLWKLCSFPLWLSSMMQAVKRLLLSYTMIWPKACFLRYSKMLVIKVQNQVSSLSK